jgi:hypothetical protein
VCSCCKASNVHFNVCTTRCAAQRTHFSKSCRLQFPVHACCNWHYQPLTCCCFNIKMNRCPGPSIDTAGNDQKVQSCCGVEAFLPDVLMYPTPPQLAACANRRAVSPRLPYTLYRWPSWLAPCRQQPRTCHTRGPAQPLPLGLQLHMGLHVSAVIA